MTQPRPLAHVYLAQLEELLRWLEALAASASSRASVLPGWDVRTLVGHLAMVHHGLIARLADRDPRPPIPLAEYVASYAGARDDIARRTSATTGDRTIADMAAW